MKRAKRPGRPAPPPATVVWRYAALVILAGLITYANSLSGPFVLDDFGNIVRNPQIRDLWDLRRVFSPLVETSVAGRPLVNLSFAINYAIGGLGVVGYHVVSLGLHLACALLLFGLVRRTLELTGAAEPLGWRPAHLATAVALLWVVHPLNSEVVDYLTERTESMMALCFLLTLYAGVRALAPARRALWYTTAVVACAAGMACKEAMVTAPVMVLIFDRIFAFDSFGAAFKARWRFYAALFGTLVVLAALLGSPGSISSGGFDTAYATPWTYFLNQTRMLTRYLWLVVWPGPLVAYYGWTQPLTLGDVWPYALLLTLLFVITGLALVRKPRLGFLGAWTFITLAPASSFVPLAAEVGAERRMYLPLMAILTLAVIAGAYVWTRIAWPSRERAMRMGAVMVLLLSTALGARTILRNEEYGSSLTLARTVLARWPGPTAHQLVGAELAAAGQHQEAIEHLRAAAPGYPPARYYLGSELFATGQMEEAIDQLQAFVRDEPRHATRAARLLIARAFLARDKTPEAIEQLQLILSASPSDTVVHGLLADALASQRRFDEAIGQYRAFLDVNPRDGNAWTGLGVALITTGRVPDAAAAFRQAVAADPGNGHFRQNLARALLDAHDPAGAAEHAEQAVALGANDPAAHEILGRVLGALGRIDDARREFGRALQLDPEYTPAREGLRGLAIK